MVSLNQKKKLCSTSPDYDNVVDDHQHQRDDVCDEHQHEGVDDGVGARLNTAAAPVRDVVGGLQNRELFVLHDGRDAHGERSQPERRKYNLDDLHGVLVDGEHDGSTPLERDGHHRVDGHHDAEQREEVHDPTQHVAWR